MDTPASRHENYVLRGIDRRVHPVHDGGELGYECPTVVLIGRHRHPVAVAPSEQMLRRSYEPPRPRQPLPARRTKKPDTNHDPRDIPAAVVEPVVEIPEVALSAAPEVEPVVAETLDDADPAFDPAVDTLLGAMGEEPPDFYAIFYRKEGPAAPSVPLTQQQIRELVGRPIIAPAVARERSIASPPAPTASAFPRSKPPKKKAKKGVGGTKTVTTATTTTVTATTKVAAAPVAPTDAVSLLKARVNMIPAEIVVAAFAKTRLHRKAATRESLLSKCDRPDVFLFEPFVIECEALVAGRVNKKGRHPPKV